MTDPVLRIVAPASEGSLPALEVDFQLNGELNRVYYRSLGEAILSANGESYLPPAVLRCLKLGGGQVIAEVDVSRKFNTSLSTIQDIFCSWYPEFHRTEVLSANPVSRPASAEGRVGAFFSSGVDSFYTFLKHRDEITDLIFIHGFDIRLGNTSLRERTSKNIHEVAVSFGKNVIEVETNLREFLSLVGWGKCFGAGLAAVGHLLSPRFRRIYIPASHSYADLLPNGSHPVLDPLWSTESLEFIHDGCEATRIEKVRKLSKHEIALRTLRVCMKNPGATGNCGRCEKCLRTMINLRVNGALDRCPAFDTELRIRDILEFPAVEEKHRVFARENLRALRALQMDPELADALQRVLDGPRRCRRYMRRLRKSARKRFGMLFGARRSR